MDIVRVELPGDAVAGVNPDFVGKKRQSLVSFIVSLASDGGVPLGGLHHLRDEQSSKQEDPAANCWKASQVGNLDRPFSLRHFG